MRERVEKRSVLGWNKSSFKKVAKVFKKISEKNAQEVANKQPEKNDIKTYNTEPQTRMAVPQPMVEITTLEHEVEPQFIVKCMTEAVVK